MITRELLISSIASARKALDRAESHIQPSGDGDEKFVAELELLDNELRDLRAAIIRTIGITQASMRRIHPYDRELEDKDNPCHCCHCVVRRQRQRGQWGTTAARFSEDQSERTISS